MNKNAFKVNGQDNIEITKHFDGDVPFYAQVMEPENVNDAHAWIASDEMEAIVSEEHGGIIGYMHKNYAQDVATVLTLHMMGRSEKIKFRETFAPTGSDYMKYAGTKFKIIRQMEPGTEYDQEEGNERMYLIELENGEQVEAFDVEVEV